MKPLLFASGLPKNERKIRSLCTIGCLSGILFVVLGAMPLLMVGHHVDENVSAFAVSLLSWFLGSGSTVVLALVSAASMATWIYAFTDLVPFKEEKRVPLLDGSDIRLGWRGPIIAALIPVVFTFMFGTFLVKMIFLLSFSLIALAFMVLIWVKPWRLSAGEL